MSIQPQQPAEYDGVQRTYDTIVSRLETRADEQEGHFPTNARSIADEFIREQVGNDRTKLSFLLNRSYKGPHRTYSKHSFDTESGIGMMKALAASALVSDAMSHE